MCAQCATTGVVAATAAATGARVWLAARAPVRLVRVIGVVVVLAGVLAAGLVA